MVLRSALILLAFLLLMVACTSEDAAPDGLVSPSPTAGTNEEPRPGDKVINLCDRPSYPDPYTILDVGPMYLFDELWGRYIRWSPDGSRILFNNPLIAGGSLHSVDPDGSSLRTVAVTPAYAAEDLLELPDGAQIRYFGNMMYFDISPDSSRIAYSTCLYTRKEPDQELSKDRPDYEDYYQVVPDIDGVGNTAQNQEASSWVYSYGIVLADIDGTNARRLTADIPFENFPTWSPDGSKIAFMDGGQLTIYSVAQGRTDTITPSLNDDRAALIYPSAWSPDGERLATVASVHDPFRSRAVYIVESDGSGVTRISDAASGPAWSPDGRRIALSIPVGELWERPRSTSDGIHHVGVGDVALYTFAADGSEPILVADSDSLPAPKITPVDPWMWALSWSPDASEILFSGFGYRVPLDGSSHISNGPSNYSMNAAWSPDGSRIAILLGTTPTGAGWEEQGVYVMDRDGTNIRALVEVEWLQDRWEIRLAE